MRLEFERLLPSLVDTQVLIDLNQDRPDEFAEVKDERNAQLGLLLSHFEQFLIQGDQVTHGQGFRRPLDVLEILIICSESEEVRHPLGIGWRIDHF